MLPGVATLLEEEERHVAAIMSRVFRANASHIVPLTHRRLPEIKAEQRKLPG